MPEIKRLINGQDIMPSTITGSNVASNTLSTAIEAVTGGTASAVGILAAQELLS